MQSYTPLRYPGGKVRLFEFVRDLINENFEVPPIYIEPFAGGAGLALKLLSNGIVSKIYINDYDYAIYCFWHSLKYKNKNFRKLVEEASFTIEEWDKQKRIYISAKKKNKSPYSKLEIGFSVFYLNRTNRSGIITAGPIGGRKQDGNYLMDCRFNKKNLLEIIDNFDKNKKNIHVYRRDAHKFISEMDSKFSNNCIFYLDPPYVQKGPDLYKNSFDKEKHTQLSDTIKTLQNRWMITYDCDPLISNLYLDYQMHEYRLSYHVQTTKLGKEYAIFSDNLKVSKKVKLKSKLK